MNKWGQWVYKSIKSALKLGVYFFMKTLSYIFPLRSRVVFSGLNGKIYNDNSRFISERLLFLYPKIKQLWIVDQPRVFKTKDSRITFIKRNSLKSFYYLATSMIWVDCSSKMNRLYKRESQVYINTWHGDRGIKKVVYDDEHFLNSIKKTKRPVFEEHACDVMIAGSKYGIKRFRQAFRYQGAILNIGSPRNDILLNHTQVDIDKVKNRLGISKRMKVLLYAPTFRRNYNFMSEKNDLDFNKMIEVLENTTGQEWVIMFRHHFANIIQQYTEDKVLDVTHYPEMNELLLITDVLISDYSSSVGDFLLLKRPVILYHNDVNDYKSIEREINIDLNQSNYSIAKNYTELISILGRISEVDWNKSCERTLNYYGAFETGKASDITARLIAELIDQACLNKTAIINQFKEEYDNF